MTGLFQNKNKILLIKLYYNLEIKKFDQSEIRTHALSDQRLKLAP